MKRKLIIRAALVDDVPAIALLIKSVAHYFYSNLKGAGADGFKSSITEASIASHIKSPEFNYIVGMFGEELVSVAALKNNKHIHHLFVLPAFHRQGVAVSCWRHLKGNAEALGNCGEFTVNSSIFAIPVYSKFGFIATTELQTKNGVEFQPMCYRHNWKNGSF